MSAAHLTHWAPRHSARQPCARVPVCAPLTLRSSRCCQQAPSGPLRLPAGAARLVARRSSSAETADVADGGARVTSYPEAGVGVPEYPVSLPPPAAAAAQARGGLPPLVWVVVGVLLAKGFDLASKLFKGGPSNMGNNVQGMMMEQMMKQMMSGKGGPMGGMGGMDPNSNPFAAMANMGGAGGAGAGGAGAANPWANMPPFPGQQQQQQQGGSPSGFPPPSSPGFPASGNFPASPAYDTTATPAAKQRAPPQTSPTEPKQQSAPAPSGAAASSAGSALPRQPAAAPPRRASFVDVDDDGGGGGGAPPTQEAEVVSSSGAAAGFPTPGGQWDAPGEPPGGGFPGANAGGAPSGNGIVAGGSTMAMLERMMTDDNLQKMLYPYLPEPMRNPETFKWMLSNPEYRQQLETMMAQQGGNPAMNGLINNFDYDSPELKQQLESIGMTPDEVLQKIMADPELAMSFSKPEVQAAIMDVTQNQMNITKYSNNPDIMAVFNKMSSLFQK